MRVDDNWYAEPLAKIDGIDANILITSLDQRYSYEECRQFDAIYSCTTGTDHIDNRDIPMFCLRGEPILNEVWATAEHTWALIMALARKIPQAHNDVCAGNWDRERWQGMEFHGLRLRDVNIGIVGYGRVGKQVDTIATMVLGAIVRECNGKEGGWPLHELLPWCDIVTVHVPYNDETHHMFGAEQFALMKPTALFINTSRGGVVDTKALITALETGQIAGAAIDVCEGEPNNIPSEVLYYANAHDNLIITPHIGGNTKESRLKTQLFIADLILKNHGGG